MTNAFIWYLAHPVAGDQQANAQRALRWLRWIRNEEPDACIIAPWLASLLAGDDDTDPKQRERALREAELVVQMCDGVVLVGGTVSPGMQRELDACADNAGAICDLTFLGAEPPSGAQLDEYFRAAGRANPYAPPSTVFDLGCGEWEAA